MIFETGDVYEGFFEEGIPNGQGQFTYANGDVETAEWDKGQRHGLSRYVGTLDNTVEEAMFWEGVAEGPATMRSADGTVEEFHYNQGKYSTVKPRFWNTSWSAANVFQNLGLFQNRGPW